VTDDVLDRSVRAYQAENPGAALDANAIRRRVLGRVGARQHRKLVLFRFATPIAAMFFVSVALAASHGGVPRFDEMRAWLGVGSVETAASVPTPEHFESAPPAPRAAPVAEPSPAPRALADEPAEPVPPRDAVRALARRSPPRRTSAPSRPGPEAPREAPRTMVPPRASSAVPDARPVPDTRPDFLTADLAAYQQAHRLHFHGADPAAALRAWDAYLMAYPTGTFAPEARFNRAVCLLRLGRRVEARSILVPIAGSSFAYGRERARALLTAME